MSKPVLQVAAAGVVGVILWQLFSGVLFGALLFVLKLALIVGVALLAVWLFKRWDNKKEDKGDVSG